MASRKTYTCFVCQKAGHEVQVFLDGKDEQGHTKYLNEDGTKHVHEIQQQQQPQIAEQQEQAYLEKVTDESIQRGITSLKAFSDIAIQIEGIETDCNQTRIILEDLQQKMDRLLSLVFAQQQKQQSSKL